MTNIEKANRLKNARKSIGFNQEQMANALNLDKTYLSQLENAHREIDDWYVRRAEEVAATFDKSNVVKEAPGNFAENDLREKCHAWLDNALDNCYGNLNILGWIYVELQRRFPVPSSSGDAVAEELLNEGAASVDGQDQASPRSPGAASPISQTSERVPVSYKRSKAKPGAPKKAPK